MPEQLRSLTYINGYNLYGTMPDTAGGTVPAGLSTGAQQLAGWRLPHFNMESYRYLSVFQHHQPNSTGNTTFNPPGTNSFGGTWPTPSADSPGAGQQVLNGIDSIILNHPMGSRILERGWAIFAWNVGALDTTTSDGDAAWSGDAGIMPALFGNWADRIASISNNPADADALKRLATSGPCTDNGSFAVFDFCFSMFSAVETGLVTRRATHPRLPAPSDVINDHEKNTEGCGLRYDNILGDPAVAWLYNWRGDARSATAGAGGSVLYETFAWGNFDGDRATTSPAAVGTITGVVGVDGLGNNVTVTYRINGTWQTVFTSANYAFGRWILDRQELIAEAAYVFAFVDSAVGVWTGTKVSNYDCRYHSRGVPLAQLFIYTEHPRQTSMHNQMHAAYPTFAHWFAPPGGGSNCAEWEARYGLKPSGHVAGAGGDATEEDLRLIAMYFNREVIDEMGKERSKPMYLVMAPTDAALFSDGRITYAVSLRMNLDSVRHFYYRGGRTLIFWTAHYSPLVATSAQELADTLTVMREFECLHANNRTCRTHRTGRSQRAA